MTRSSGPDRLIGIDARSLSSGPPGVGTYVSNLIRRIHYLDPLAVTFPRNNFLWNQLRVPPAFRSRGWAAYHAPAYTAPLLDCRPLILTVHDISYLANPDWYPYPVDSLRLRYYAASLRCADRIIVPSDFSRTEILKLFPRLETRIRRVYQGVCTSTFFPDPEEADKARRELSLPGPFLLHVGDIHKRRNVPLAVAASQTTGIPLVLVGHPLQGGEQFERWPLRFSGLSTDRLRGLYSAALAFVYPSVYEGFGLPILEAMACGLPVVATRAACLPEVCGEAAVLVEPDARSFCEGIQRVKEHVEHYRQAGMERSRAFSWETTARETERVYAEVVPGIASLDEADESLTPATRHQNGRKAGF
jgi:glycosyltransferase involved in cell wall biosynthesis